MVTDDRYVKKGKTLTHEGKSFGEGCRFPAAKLGIDQKVFDSLIKDGALVTGKERNEFAHPEGIPPKAVPKEGDGLEDMSKGDLLEIAHKLDLQVATRSSKDEIIAAIRGKK